MFVQCKVNGGACLQLRCPAWALHYPRLSSYPEGGEEPKLDRGSVNFQVNPRYQYPAEDKGKESMEDQSSTRIMFQV